MQPSDHTSQPERLTWLAEIYRTYAADLQRYVYSKVGDPFLAEDLTSMVFLKALRWLREDQSKESVRGWLYATARTTIVDHWQMLGQYETPMLASLEEQFSSPPERTETARQQAEMRVQRLLSLLPERERKVLTLRYLQGYSAAEIAVALGTNAGHIRVLQLRALKRAAQLETQEHERNVYIMQESESAANSIVPFLTAQSLRVLDLAREEAQTLKHEFCGTEHILWGLTSEGSLASFLTPLGVTPERIHAGIVFIYDRRNMSGSAQGAPPTHEPEALKALTPRAKKALVLAKDEMKSQGGKTISPAHMLLGLLNEGEGIAAGLLRSLGVNFSQARAVLSPPTTNQVCSFCGRTGPLVKHIFPAEVPVSGSTASPLICDVCVERFHTLLAQF